RVSPTVFSVAARGSPGRDGAASGRPDGAHGSLHPGRDERRRLVRARVVSAPRGTPPPTGRCQRGTGGTVFPAGARYRPPPGGEVPGAAGRQEPGTPVAAPGQAGRGLRAARTGVRLVHRRL